MIIINTDIDSFILKFNAIRDMGFVDEICHGTAAVGRTFESLLGIKGNCDVFPDYNGIEIKTKCSNLYSKIALFNCTPVGQDIFELDRIRARYGYPDKDYKKYKVLYASVNCLEKKKAGIFYKFQLKIDEVNRKLLLLVFNLKDELIDDSTFWPLDLLEMRFVGKCENLALVNANRFFNNGIVSFYYDRLRIMRLSSFNNFIELLKQGIISVNFKIGIVKSGERFGSIYDHGTAFEINETDLNKLYSVVYDSN